MIKTMYENQHVWCSSPHWATFHCSYRKQETFSRFVLAAPSNRNAADSFPSALSPRPHTRVLRFIHSFLSETWKGRPEEPATSTRTRVHHKPTRKDQKTRRGEG